MKKFALLLSFVFLAGAAYVHAAPETKTLPSKAGGTTVPAVKLTHETAEIVSVSEDGATITVKGHPADKTITVAAAAQAAAKQLKAGEKVGLVLDPKGEVTSIKVAALPKK